MRKGTKRITVVVTAQSYYHLRHLADMAGYNSIGRVIDKLVREHLCAMRNGQKVTYEKLFYHIPKRRNAGGATVGKNRGQSSDFRHCGARGANPTSSEAQPGRPQGFPAQRGSWCKKLKIEYIRLPRLNQPQRSVVRQAQDQIFRKPYHEGRYKNRGVPRHRSG